MKIKTLLALAAILPLATACDDGEKPECDTAVEDCKDSGEETGEECDSAATPGDANCDGVYDGPTEITDIEADCDSSKWWYYVDTAGWTTGGFLDVEQTGSTNGWTEEHNIDSVDWDEDKWWDRLERELPIVTDFNLQETDVNTLYECSDSRASSLTWAIRVYDEAGTLADCAVWGHKTSFFLDQSDFSSCIDWNG